MLLALIVVNLVSNCASPSTKTETSPQPQSVNELPEITVTTLDGSKVEVDELKGKNILILFQTECDHCQREAQEIRKHIEEFKDYNLYFISADQWPAIGKFAKDYDLANHANVYFAFTTVQNVLDYFGSIPSPSVYIYVDQRLVQKFNGEVPIEKILQAI